MQHTTRSLLVAFGSAAALVAAPLVLDVQGRTAADEAVAVPGAATAGPASAPDLPPIADGPAGVSGSTGAPAGSGAMTAPVPLPTDAGRPGDLPQGFLSATPSPRCPVTEEGAWWTDPADPSTCLRPGSVPFFEPAPPGIPPELLEPIFEEPPTLPGTGEDCRVTGTRECVVDIMGQGYVVTFADGKPVGVVEAQR
ncbi:hypothetical protein IWX63_002258 [Arthrobacter sp. CAN_A2]|uniref:hypothetical protein n=1 Tax=Arthrobacter sp. CAN_A2 TaxID=2787718 RepID=UPI0018EFE26D